MKAFALIQHLFIFSIIFIETSLSSNKEADALNLYYLYVGRKCLGSSKVIFGYNSVCHGRKYWLPSFVAHEVLACFVFDVGVKVF